MPMRAQLDEPNAITRPLIVPSAPLPTMKIASDDAPLGYVIINVSDFDAATMTAYAEPSKPKARAAKGAE